MFFFKKSELKNNNQIQFQEKKNYDLLKMIQEKKKEKFLKEKV